jgi:hypothetical protein
MFMHVATPNLIEIDKVTNSNFSEYQKVAQEKLFSRQILSAKQYSSALSGVICATFLLRMLGVSVNYETLLSAYPRSINQNPIFQLKRIFRKFGLTVLSIAQPTTERPCIFIGKSGDVSISIGNSSSGFVIFCPLSGADLLVADMRSEMITGCEVYMITGTPMRSFRSRSRKVHFYTQEPSQLEARVDHSELDSVCKIISTLCTCSNTPSARPIGSVEDLLKLHASLCSCGRGPYGVFRDVNLSRSGVVFADATEVRWRTEKLIEYFVAEQKEKSAAPGITAAIIYSDFNSIHPFLNGNGRIGKIIVDLYLKSQGKFFEWGHYTQSDVYYLARVASSGHLGRITSQLKSSIRQHG